MKISYIFLIIIPFCKTIFCSDKHVAHAPRSNYFEDKRTDYGTKLLQSTNLREHILHLQIPQFFKDFQTGLTALIIAQNKESTQQTRKNIRHIQSILVATPVCWQRSTKIVDYFILSEIIEAANQLKAAMLEDLMHQQPPPNIATMDQEKSTRPRRRPSSWAELREDLLFFKKGIPRSAFDDLKSDESDPGDF